MRHLLSFVFTFCLATVGLAQIPEPGMPLFNAKSDASKTIYWNTDSTHSYRYYSGNPYLMLRYVTNNKNSIGQTTNYLLYGRSDTAQSLSKWDSVNIIYNQETAVEKTKFPLIGDQWGDTSYCVKYDSEGKKVFYLYHNYDHASNSWDNGSKNYYYYTDQGLLEKILTYEIYSSGSWFLARKTSFFYNDTLLDHKIYYNWDSSNQVWNGSYKKTYSYSYISSANAYVVDTIISYDLPSTSPVWVKHQLEKYIYSSSLKVIEYYRKLWDDNNNDWINYIKNTYDYDSLDRVIERIEYRYNSNTWKPTSRKIYIYTSTGKIDSTVNYTWYITNWRPSYAIKYVYDNDNQLIEQKYSSYDGILGWSPLIKYEFYYSKYFISNIDKTYPNTLQISPNPTTGIIRLSNIQGNGTIQILNLNGQVVFSKKINGEKTFDLTILPSDVYIIKITQPDGNTYIGKFIKL